jgi:hypothetical protein
VAIGRTCRRIAWETKQEVQDTFAKLKGGLGNTRMLLRQVGLRADAFMRSLGPAGEELAEQVTRTVRRAQKASDTDAQAVADILRGVSTKDRRTVGEFLRFGADRDVTISDALRDKANQIRTVLDRQMNLANSLGFLRLDKKGVARPVTGSGNPMPQVLNRRGQRVFRNFDRNKPSAEMTGIAERMVATGQASSIERALDDLAAYNTERLAGINGYFERRRIDLPAEWLELDPAKVLPFQIERNWLSLEGARTWGWRHPSLEVMLGRVGREAGPHAGKIVKEHLQLGFGVAGPQNPYASRFFGTLSNWETASKLSGVFSPILNFGQRFTNTISAPFMAHADALKAHPPVAWRWLREARQLHRDIEASGALRGRNVLTDIQQGGLGDGAVQLSIKPFMAVAKDNEFYSALVARYALERDIDRLIKLQGRTSPLAKMADMVTSMSVDPEGVALRNIARRVDMTDKRILDRLASGARFTPEEVAFVMQKAVEDEQFSMNMLTQPIWYGTNPLFRLLWKFKTFGVRQTEFIWNNVAQEAMRGNMKPMAKFIGATILLGEVYHTARDLLEGTERGVTMTLLNTPPERRTPEILVDRIVGNMIAQGALGIFSDLTWGVSGWVAGPFFGSTIDNVKDFAEHVALSATPQQVGLASVELLRDEIVPFKQGERLWLKSKERLENDPDRARFSEYWRFRNGAFQFRRDQERETPLDPIRAGAQRAIRGTQDFPKTERSLAYKNAARLITLGDTDAAVTNLEQILKGVTDFDDRDRLLRGMRQSMVRNAPLGALNLSQQDDYLATLKPGDRESARRLQDQWTRRYEDAIREADIRTR